MRGRRPSQVRATTVFCRRERWRRVELLLWVGGVRSRHGKVGGREWGCACVCGGWAGNVLGETRSSGRRDANSQSMNLVGPLRQGRVARNARKDTRGSRRTVVPLTSGIHARVCLTLLLRLFLRAKSAMLVELLVLRRLSVDLRADRSSENSPPPPALLLVETDPSRLPEPL